MTSEEAIKRNSYMINLMYCNAENCDGECEKCVEANSMAIKALKAVGNSDKLEQKSKKHHWNHLYDLWECECGRFIDDEWGYCPWCGCELDWEEE